MAIHRKPKDISTKLPSARPHLADEGELYKYMRSLSSVLRSRNASSLSETVARAAATAAGNMSTEFLGESRIALKRVASLGITFLSVDELKRVNDVIEQINDAFDRRQ